jgi:hypothetical protein
MSEKPVEKGGGVELPECAAQFIRQVIRRMCYTRRARRDVQAELTAHFEDELRGCPDATERERKAQRLIEEFGDAKLLAALCRRAKKRCRPPWKKAVVRFMQVFGILICYVAICTLPLFLGKATIKTNYVEWLNETVRGGREESDNARPYYDKAAKLQVEMPEWLALSRVKWPGDMNDVEVKLLSDWLSQNAPALDAIKEGSRHPYCWSSYESKPVALSQGAVTTSEVIFAGILDDSMSLVATYRRLAFTLQWQIRYEAFNVEMDAAFNDCLVLARFGDHVLGHGLSHEQIVGMGIESMANDSLLSLLGRPGVDLDMLKKAQSEWQERLNRLGAGPSFDGEKGLWLDRIQRGFTDDGNGDGHALAREPAYWMNGYQDWWRVLTWRCPTRREVLGDIDAYYSHLNKLLAEPPWQWHREDMNVNDSPDAIVESLKLAIQTPRKFRLADLLLKMQSTSDRALVEMSWRQQTKGIAVLTVLALERYRMEQGQYPADLKQVVDAGYLLEVPRDPYGPGPLSYRKTDHDFILYSWDEDRKDDGGRRGADKDTSDWVFWPVSP